MSTVRRFPGKSRKWYAVYKKWTGVRFQWTQKSTGTTDRQRAQEICLNWQRLEEEGRQGLLTEARARQVITEIVERNTGKPLQFFTVESWLNHWKAEARGENSAGTTFRYDNIVENFLDFLGSRKGLSINAITPDDLKGYRERKRTDKLSSSTLNTHVKVLGAAFNAAYRQGYIQTNPVRALRSLRGDAVSRETFTVDQIKLLLTAANSVNTNGTYRFKSAAEWSLLILLGFFTGARMSDLTALRWENINFADRVITFAPRKTQGKGVKMITTPIHPDLETALKRLQTASNTSGNVFAELSQKTSAGRSGLSMQFKRIMEKAGVAGTVLRTAEGKGRTTSSLSFHSLRHSFNSALANRGVPQEMRMKLLGHTRAATNEGYTHLELGEMRAAVLMLPGVTDAA